MPLTMTHALRPHLALLLCNTIWALDYPFYVLVLGRYIQPLPMVTAALLITALLSLIPRLWESPERVETRDKWIFAGAALLVAIVRKLLMMYGLSFTSPIDGAIISTIGPLLILVLSVAIGRDHFTRRKVIGCLLGMGGAIAVVMTSGGSQHAHSDLTGNLLLFGASCTTALYMVFFKGTIARYKVTTVMRWIYCLGALMLLPFGAESLLKTDFGALHGRIAFATAFVIFVPTYLPNLMLNFALKRISSTITGIYSYLQPLLAILISVAMGLDKLHADTLIFGLIIGLGVWLVVGAYHAPTHPDVTIHQQS